MGQTITEQRLITWHGESPTEAGWYIAAYETADDPPRVATTLLWFNPSAWPQWWIGTAGRSVEFEQPIVCWTNMIAPPIDKVYKTRV